MIVQCRHATPTTQARLHSGVPLPPSTFVVAAIVAVAAAAVAAFASVAASCAAHAALRASVPVAQRGGRACRADMTIPACTSQKSSW